MTPLPRAAFPLLARLAVYYGVVAAASVFLARWLPAVPLVGTRTAAIAMLGALALVIPVAWTYMRTKPRPRYDASLVHTVIVLPVVVAGIVLIIRDSLALAFSLAGVVAAVRFRNTLRDTKDAVYIFLAIGLGLAAGVQAFSSAFVMSVVFVLVVIALWRFNVGAAPPAARGLVVADGARVAAEPAIAEALDRHARRWKLLHEAPADDGRAILTYVVRLRRRTSINVMVDEVRRAAGPGAAIRFEPRSG